MQFEPLMRRTSLATAIEYGGNLAIFLKLSVDLVKNRFMNFATEGSAANG